MDKKVFIFMIIFLCFSGYGYADVTYDILDYYPLTPGYAWTSKDGRHKKIIDYGHNLVDVTRFYSGDSPTRGNIMAYDADYLYTYCFYLTTKSGEKKVYEIRPVLKLKRNIHIGESIGYDFAIFYEGVSPGVESYSRTLISVEDVTTPAGTFKDCLKFARVASGVTTYDWWARGVGIVKSIGEYTFEVASYNFDASSNHIPGGHNAVPSSALSIVDFPTSVTPANNQVQVGACDDAMIQPTLAIPSSDVGKTATLIMYIYLPDANFGINIPSKTKVLTSETKFDLLPNAIDFSTSANLNLYVYYGYVINSVVKYNAYSIEVGSSCSNLVPNCGSITGESSCNANANCEWQYIPSDKCILKCSQFTDECTCNAVFNGGCEWNSLLDVCTPK